MLKLALGATIHSVDVIIFFGHMTFLAVFLGVVIGNLAVILIARCIVRHNNSNAMIQTVATLSCGYLVFFLAESEFSTSGVIATVTAGLTIAYSSWPLFLSRETINIV